MTDLTAERMLDNLMYCNAQRFGGANMLSNRTFVELAEFISRAIFDEFSHTGRFVRQQKDLFPFKTSDTETEFIVWTELFRRYYESDDK